MEKEKTYKFVVVLMLLFLAVPVASAQIEIIDMGQYYDGIDRLGYVDYQNMADLNLSGAILVFIDGDIAAGKILDMPIRYVACFRCSPIKTLEFALNETEGDHRIVAYVFSMNCSVERTYEYYAKDWWVYQVDEIESEQEEDWLTCWMNAEEEQ